MKTEFQKELEGLIKYNDSKIQKLKERLTKSFVYELPWIGEDMWKFSYINEHYKVILAELETEPEKKVIEKWINQFQYFVSQSYNVRENSTGALHREVSTWKFITKLELLNYLASKKD